MFTRTHRIGRHIYTEALEGYRDPIGRPRYRCVARWRADRTLAEEIGRTHYNIEQATRRATYYQGIVERTVRANHPKHHKHARQRAKDWQRHLDTATARHGGLSVDDAEVERAAQAKAAEWGARTDAMFQPREEHPIDLAGIAERLRRLATQNVPDVLRVELAAIAASLDALSLPATPP